MRLENFYRSICEAFNSLLMLKGRSLLALLGVITGCASVVALISTSKMAAADTEKIFGNIGLDTFSGSINWEQGAGFRNWDFSDLSSQSNVVTRIAPLAMASKQLAMVDEMIDYTIIGSNAELQNTLELKLIAGRFISDFDKKERYAVVGNKLANKLEVSTHHSYIKIGGYFYKVIGILKERDVSSDLLPFNPDFSVIIHHNGMAGTENDATVNTFVGRSHSETVVQHDVERLNSILSTFPGINSFYINVPKALMESVRHQRANFTFLLLALGGVTLIGGGIGIMNMMVMNVSLRRQEIGLRLAIGARKKDILMLFMLETIVLTVTGVFIGIIIGTLISATWAWQADWQFNMSFTALALGGGSALMTGIISGLWPAIAAAKLRPVEALRET